VEPAAIIVVRAWADSRTSEGFRARVRVIPNIERPAEVTETVVASPAQAAAVVCDSLEAFTRGSRE
jgi:hypothetical protein